MTRGKWITLSVLVTLTGLGTVAYLWAKGAFDQPDAEVTEHLSAVEDSNMMEALRLIKDAREKFANVQDYRCVYLREEVIDGKLLSNHVILQVRHEPFSVGMEWLGPTSKKGRKTVWVAGRNNNKMLVRQSIIKMELDPQESIRRRESRHTIDEAGIKNLINRYHTSWERELKLGLTQVSLQDSALTVKLGGREIQLDCICITATHSPGSQQHFLFQVTKLYIDKKTGLPVRSENFDFPGLNRSQGVMVERYTYLDLQTNVGLTDAHFTLQ